MTVERQMVRQSVLDALAPNLKLVSMTPESLEGDAEVDLYRSGICDSFDIVELVMGVEKTTGLRCNLANESAEDFVLTLTRLIDSFVEA
jgi:acyl carrier protein